MVNYFSLIKKCKNRKKSSSRLRNEYDIDKKLEDVCHNLKDETDNWFISNIYNFRG